VSQSEGSIGLSHADCLSPVYILIHIHVYKKYTCTNIPVLDGVDEEVDKPCEGVLVHGINVRQISYTEEQVSRVLGYRPITHTGGLYFLLGLLSDL